MRQLVFVLAGAWALLAGVAAPPVVAQTTAAATTRDGRADFGFLIGTWRTHYRRLSHALVNSHAWYDCAGTSTVTTFWQGSGNIEDGDLRCPHQYIKGLTIRLYNAGTHQWSLYWATAKNGIAFPPQIGHFDAKGVGDFYGNDTYDGKPIVVRYRWSLQPGNHPHFEQAFSADGGKTWETNWTTDYTRIR